LSKVKICNLNLRFLSPEPLERLPGRRLGLFSYGSGFVSSFYSIVVSGDSSPDSPLASLKRSIADVPARMDARRKVDPADYDRVMKLRESVLHREPGHTYTPVSSTDNLFPGTWYLADIDAKHRRSYEKAGSGDEKTNGLTTKQNGFAKAAAASASQ
jgi:hydroxymethylglutaryl-CoA synthase